MVKTIRLPKTPGSEEKILVVELTLRPSQVSGTLFFSLRGTSVSNRFESFLKYADLVHPRLKQQTSIC